MGFPKPYILLQGTAGVFIPTPRAKGAAGFPADESIQL